MEDKSSNSADKSGSLSDGRVVIGIGGNQGAVLATFRRALDLIDALVPIAGLSCLYRSAPIGPSQPDFLNGAFAVGSQTSLHELLCILQTVETELGRVRQERWGPRVVDLDILWAGAQIISTSSLTVPHDELVRRAFALRPLLDLEPGAKDPVGGASYASILSSLNEQVLEQISPPIWWKEGVD